MLLGDPAHDRETKASAASAPALPRLCVSVEQSLRIHAPETRSTIADGKADQAAAPEDGSNDCAARRRELDGVVQQREGRLPQGLGIAGRGCLAFKPFEFRADFVCGGVGSDSVDRAADHRVQIGRSHPQGQRPILGPRQAEEVVEAALEVATRCGDAFERIAMAGRIGPAQGDARLAKQHRHRRAQFVADVGEELASRLVHAAQRGRAGGDFGFKALLLAPNPFRHRVESIRQSRELTGQVGRGARIAGAASKRLGDGGQSADRRDKTAVEDHPCGGGGQKEARRQQPAAQGHAGPQVVETVIGGLCRGAFLLKRLHEQAAEDAVAFAGDARQKVAGGLGAVEGAAGPTVEHRLGLDRAEKLHQSPRPKHVTARRLQFRLPGLGKSDVDGAAVAEQDAAQKRRLARFGHVRIGLDTSPDFSQQIAIEGRFDGAGKLELIETALDPRDFSRCLLCAGKGYQRHRCKQRQQRGEGRQKPQRDGAAAANTNSPWALFAHDQQVRAADLACRPRPGDAVSRARETASGNRAMRIVRTVAELRAQRAAWRAEGLTMALTPTMGALHAGHASLVTLARTLADRVTATIFVNPTQFGPAEDLAAYPRDEGADARMLAGAGCDLLFAPDVPEMYPVGFATRVRVDGVSAPLCGASRPGHFDGVAQVVTKLLNQAQADVALFGEKDWQQLAVIRRLARDLDIDTRIVGAPTVREADGLAMSSRNRYLTPAERAAAPALFAALTRAAGRIAARGDVVNALAEGRAAVMAAGFSTPDYFEARDAETLDPVDSFNPDRPARIFAAARLGRARLIDNVAVQVAND